MSFRQTVPYCKVKNLLVLISVILPSEEVTSSKAQLIDCNNISPHIYIYIYFCSRGQVTLLPSRHLSFLPAVWYSVPGIPIRCGDCRSVSHITTHASAQLYFTRAASVHVGLFCESIRTPCFAGSNESGEPAGYRIWWVLVFPSSESAVQVEVDLDFLGSFWFNLVLY